MNGKGNDEGLIQSNLTFHSQKQNWPHTVKDYQIMV